ncbi:MAG: IclR family transcriptional regulator [Alphaproteobacteria bacterium]|jgi:DNA-binding IclR family transcriptional regulator|nr:IclR family transcriptional regulator [Alphaproteobacteria bacterium]
MARTPEKSISLASDESDDSNKTPPNLRMLSIISLLATQGQPMSIQEMINHLGWPKQSLHRLVQSLVDNRYLERQGRRYSPSKQLSNMANGILHFAPNLHARHRILTQLSADSGETVNFVMPMEDGMTYVDRVDTNWPFRILLPIGSSVPFHCTASGKTYLASIRGDQRRRFLAGLTLDQHTENTHTSTATLETELKVIRRQGYALDDEEFFDNMYAIAVPVFDLQGRFHAALATHGPKQRFNKDQAMALVDRLKDYSAQITALTFASPTQDDRRDADF